MLIAGASATVDRRDVVPSAILRAGGAIDHFGMPADPGNLLLLGHVGAARVVNLPGCARSAKPNGLDWVLARFAAGVPIRPADVMRMGASGLLKQLGARPPESAWLEPPARDARIAALIQAAGPEAPLAEVEAALAAGLDPVVVLAAADYGAMAEALPPCEVICIDGTDAAAGLDTLPEDVDAALLLPAGCPDISPEAVTELVKAFDPDEGRAIVLPKHGNHWGVVARDLFRRVGKSGLAALAAEKREAVFEVALP
ncbi:MAG: hypothetical protein NVV74_21320 [Magnetospirillum sp.]|nr:hypothetical protein [Magnetospirillum sp.]